MQEVLSNCFTKFSVDAEVGKVNLSTVDFDEGKGRNLVLDFLVFDFLPRVLLFLEEEQEDVCSQDFELVHSNDPLQLNASLMLHLPLVVPQYFVEEIDQILG